MAVVTTPLYAALLALLFLVLSTRVVLYRREKTLNLGDEGDRQLLKRMRAQANCAEYAPLGILLLLLAELQGAPATALHMLGLALLGGRVLHGIGLSSNPQRLVLRQIGMVLTLSMICVAALGLLAHWLI